MTLEKITCIVQALEQKTKNKKQNENFLIGLHIQQHWLLLKITFLVEIN